MPNPKPKHRVTISIVSWNSQLHLPTCFHAIDEQAFSDTHVMLIDNASADTTVKWFEEYYPQHHLLRNTRNLGFCRAQNQAIRITNSDYILVLNPDVVMSPKWLERAVRFMDQHPKVGSYGGKLKRFTYSPDELKEVVISDIIDSAGLSASRSRHFVDRGAGETDTGQFDQTEEVFGLSGACVLYRRRALESIRFGTEYFDEDFFAYKDDIDLAWRLQRHGWEAWYDGSNIAWHHREIKGIDRASTVQIAKNYRSRKDMIASFSYRNHWWLLKKFETGGTLIRDVPWIAWYEFRKLVFLLFTRPWTLRTLGRVLRGWPRMRRKHAVLEKHASRSAGDIRKRWLV